VSNNPPIILNYGGGTNSTAVAIGLHQRGIRPDLVIFADTGGEKPETYRYLEIFNDYLKSVDFPELTIVRHTTLKGQTSLEQKCLEGQTLPAVAYGFKSCSSDWKRHPIDKFTNNWQPAKDCWKTSGRIVKILGYDTGEERRATRTEDKKHTFWYPLIEWDWSRDECIKAIVKAGLPLPGKSSCFFCPSQNKAEVLKLKSKHPSLFERDLAIESAAASNPISPSKTGLGRSFSWAAISDYDDRQQALQMDLPCDCYDGDD
jgi:hypothetical protein